MLLHENRLDQLKEEQSIGIKLSEPVDVDQKSKDLVDVKKNIRKMSLSLLKKYNPLCFTPLVGSARNLDSALFIVGDVLIEAGFKLSLEI